MIDVLLRQKAVQTQEFALCRAKGFYLFLMSRAVNIVNIIQVDLNPLLLTAGSMLRGLKAVIGLQKHHVDWELLRAFGLGICLAERATDFAPGE